jgi:hypothetical protein
MREETFVSQQVTLIFLSMALVAALSEFQKIPKHTLHWVAFLYFVANNIRYFYGDMRWSESDSTLRKDNPGVERAVDVHFYVITRLLVVLQALQINDLQHFLWMLAAAQFVGAIYLVISMNLIYDLSKDQKLRKVQWHWFWFNVAELATTLVGSLILMAREDICRILPSLGVVDLYAWAVGLVFLILFLIQLLDWTMHQEFLFGTSSKA